jgi:hypothetical protein
MGTNSTDAAANRASDAAANKSLASISPFFIVKDLQVGTNGLAGTRISTPWTPIRSSTSSASAVPHSQKRCRSLTMGCGASRSWMPTGMSLPSFAFAAALRASQGNNTAMYIPEQSKNAM